MLVQKAVHSGAHTFGCVHLVAAIRIRLRPAAVSGKVFRGDFHTSLHVVPQSNGDI